MQIQSDLLNISVVRPEITETTALGAAYLAGLGVGFWSNTADIQSQWAAERTFSPQLDDAERKTADHRWQRAIRATLNWAEDR